MKHSNVSLNPVRSLSEKKNRIHFPFNSIWNQQHQHQIWRHPVLCVWFMTSMPTNPAPPVSKMKFTEFQPIFQRQFTIHPVWVVSVTTRDDDFCSKFAPGRGDRPKNWYRADVAKFLQNQSRVIGLCQLGNVLSYGNADLFERNFKLDLVFIV